ncbi:MAG: hypothetical protein FIA97_13335 [Methylococcaceae bacterium]|nr:hypothetical protein [Desulfuromonas sp.]NJD07464.1 hypothetical protein [Methylococcaceae bacterium]
MILSMQNEKLSPHLQDLAPLLDAYQKGDPAFPDAALKWLSEVEKTMSSVRLREGSEISTLRGRILKASDALNAGGEKPPRSQVKSARNVAAAEALERGEEILRTIIQTNQERLQRFEDKLCEGMTALALLVEIPLRQDSTTQWLTAVWRLLRSQDSTRPLATYLAASLNGVDRLFILEAVLGRMTAPDPEDGP